MKPIYLFNPVMSGIANVKRNNQYAENKVLLAAQPTFQKTPQVTTFGFNRVV